MVSVTLSQGETKTIYTETGLVEFKVKLVDIVNVDVEIHKCVQSQCEFHDIVFADSHSVVSFKDIITGLTTVQYRFIVKNQLFGKLNVIPRVINVNDIVKRTTSLLETIFTSLVLSKIRG